jgi:diguanylate cyclase (GGDEF)-like protein
MTPRSISRLAAWFVFIGAALIVTMMAAIWLEVERVSNEIRARESQGARAEIVEGLAELERNATNVAQALANWDETRQQLAFSDYYSLWRDKRVTDAGMVSDRVLGVALYDKQGNILAPSRVDRPMPAKLPGQPPLALLMKEKSGSHLLVFVPAHADPQGGILLGHVGIKFDFIGELRHARVYKYVDLDRLRVTVSEGSSVKLDRAIEFLDFVARDNPEMTALHQLFRNSLVRLVAVILLLFALAAWLLRVLMVKPLRSLSREIDSLREPNGVTALAPSTTLPVLELENVRRSINDYQTRLSELHSNLEQNSRDFHDQARRDALTGSFNRRAFDEDWKSLGDDRRLSHVALLLFDCDHFKAINDTYGHQVGDHVIQAIASALHSALRANDRLYRLGGDEFATLLREADEIRAERVAERCIEHVLGIDFHQFGMSEPVTISIGLAVSEGEGLTLHDLQKRADLAMYTAKRPGSRKLVFYHEDMGGMAALVANKDINAVFQAIANPELIQLHYQSVMRLPIATREYVEALARIRIEGELIGPAAIFPIVSARNLDMEFDLAVLSALRHDLQRGHLGESQGVSVNLSAPSIVNAKVVDALIELIEAHPGRKIVAEITETALITQIEIASDNIRRLRDAGCLVALDDFGSGYSSLRYLASMPVDLVKFDISMVRMLESGEPRQQLMMEEITRLVVTAGYQMVAEGVESRALLDKVVALGFSHAQGYYFDRPQPHL